MGLSDLISTPPVAPRAVHRRPVAPDLVDGRDWRIEVARRLPQLLDDIPQLVALDVRLSEQRYPLDELSDSAFQLGLRRTARVADVSLPVAVFGTVLGISRMPRTLRRWYRQNPVVLDDFPSSNRAVLR